MQKSATELAILLIINIMRTLDRFGRAYVSSSGPSSLVRLQDYVDADLSSASEAGIRSKIQLAQDKLAKAAVGDDVTLYPRHWMEASPSARKNDDRGSNKSTFTVAQFNMLARGLSSGPAEDAPTPFEISMSNEGYGGFIGVPNPEVVFDFEIRKWRLLQVLLGGGLGDEDFSTHDASKPPFDILALEEVDEYNSFFGPVLLGDGGSDGTPKGTCTLGCYRGVFQPKPSSPCVPFGYYSDGVALLWSTDKFDTIDRPSSSVSEPWIEKSSFSGTADVKCDDNQLSRQNQVYAIIPLHLKGTDKCIIVAATHLKAKRGAANDRMRKGQAMELRQRAEAMADAIKRQGRWKEVSILILGDFNAEPSDEAVKCFLSQRELPWKYDSAYDFHCLGYTSWKTRASGTTRRIIDYIIYSSNSVERMECTHVLSVTEGKDIEKGYLPGLRYPSDHLLLAAKFQC